MSEYTVNLVTLEDGTSWIRKGNQMVLIPSDVAELIRGTEEATVAPVSAPEPVEAPKVAKPVQEVSTATVRAWAQKQARFKGMVKDRGRIPAEIVEAFTASVS